MRILITGFGGFVSQHFLSLLNETEPGSEILGIDKNQSGFDYTVFPDLSISFRQVDLLNRTQTENILNLFSPDYILHLASVSSVAQSWHTPYDSFVNNTNIFLNLVEQIRLKNNKCRILSIGSSEEFGTVSEDKLPLTEEHPLKPVSPYAVARVSQEMLSGIYADGFGLDIVMTRSFNHIGPGQRENFVISSFAKQLVSLSGDKKTAHKIITGNLSVIRDFVDVRDVVKAYYLLLLKGKKGEIYNICSGKGFLLKELLHKMSEILNVTVLPVEDKTLFRPNENKKVIGSYAKIKNELGWYPSIPIEKSLADIIDYWKSKSD